MNKVKDDRFHSSSRLLPSDERTYRFHPAAEGGLVAAEQSVKRETDGPTIMTVGTLVTLQRKSSASSRALKAAYSGREKLLDAGHFPEIVDTRNATDTICISTQLVFHFSSDDVHLKK